jgi:hypothetical protein
MKVRVYRMAVPPQEAVVNSFAGFGLPDASLGHVLPTNPFSHLSADIHHHGTATTFHPYHVMNSRMIQVKHVIDLSEP